MNNDELIKKRFIELANKSYKINQYTFTGFLNMMEIDLFYKTYSEIKNVVYTMFGGLSGCERVMIRFGDKKQLGFNEEFPINCIKVQPLAQKFADQLNHRDFLGALMNLGIDRSVIGDIILQGNNGYIFCISNISDFILNNLTKVKNTNINCMITNELANIKREFKEDRINIASERIDLIIAKAYNLSRNDSITMFRTKKIFVNGRLCENNSYSTKKDDVISVRGYGKFIYVGQEYITRKGKLNVIIKKYIS